MRCRVRADRIRRLTCALCSSGAAQATRPSARQVRTIINLEAAAGTNERPPHLRPIHPAPRRPSPLDPAPSEARAAAFTMDCAATSASATGSALAVRPSASAAAAMAMPRAHARRSGSWYHAAIASFFLWRDVKFELRFCGLDGCDLATALVSALRVRLGNGSARPRRESSPGQRLDRDSGRFGAVNKLQTKLALITLTCDLSLSHTHKSHLT